MNRKQSQLLEPVEILVSGGTIVLSGDGIPDFGEVHIVRVADHVLHGDHIEIPLNYSTARFIICVFESTARRQI
ncbi:hypothetical protein [Halostagnicola kamekurae]|uniref:hypothetical protein n=1 Tax=Halostagnicola kamekurae TaxID=619731 RepID=UPI001587EBCB|nr:hypothetical protein [Halostagnicola kamekurae]